MKKVSYDEAKKIVDGNKNKIIALVLSSLDCPFCESYKNLAIDKVEKELDYVKWYELTYNENEVWKYFPPQISPLTFFHVPNSEMNPFIRPGGAPPENIIQECEKFKRVMNGEKISEVFK